MKARPRIFYAWLLPCIWVLAGVSSLRFPAAEGLSLLFVYIPSLWTIPVHFRAGTNAQTALVGGTAIILIIGLFLDRLRAKIKTWLTSMVISATCCLITVIYFYCSAAIREKSFKAAAHRFDLDQPDRVLGYLFFCVTGGILTGSVVTIPVTVIQKRVSASSAEK